MFTSFSQAPNIAAGNATDNKNSAAPSNPQPASMSAPNSSTGAQTKATLTKKTLSPIETEELEKKYEELKKQNIYLGFENRCLHDINEKLALRRGLPATFI